MITIFCYVYIIDIYEGNQIFLSYLFFLSLGILSIQSVGHIIGILFSESENIALLFSAIYGVFIYFLSNFLIPIKELHYTIQWLSNISTIKLIFESTIILFYGFDRCSDREFSSVMYLLDLNDGIFYLNIRILIYQFLIFRSLAIIVLLIKANPMKNKKRARKLNESAFDLLNQSNAQIHGLSSILKYKIKN
jgi:ABC-type multidrug transport system permease subunit